MNLEKIMLESIARDLAIIKSRTFNLRVVVAKDKDIMEVRRLEIGGTLESIYLEMAKLQEQLTRWYAVHNNDRPE